METLDGEYFVWLCRQVGVVRRRARKDNYYNIMKMLYTKEFVWIILKDENRAAEGLELRREFLEDRGFTPDPSFLELGCDMLELFVGLARRFEYLWDAPISDRFWFLMGSLGLEAFNDSVSIPEELVLDRLDRFMWRQYDYDGTGGLFPLKNPQQDQRNVELWFQMNYWSMENIGD